MKFLQKNSYYFALIVAIIAISSSLYSSEIAHLVPCVLCWYQRILMYPLVIIIAVGILRKDKGLPLYVLPMSIGGVGIALFHYLLQLGIIPDALGPCQLGVSCTTIYIAWFGFITIPFLSLLAFVTITILMYISWMYTKKKNK